MKFWSVLLPVSKKVQYKKEENWQRTEKDKEQEHSAYLSFVYTLMGPCEVDFLFSIKFKKPRCLMCFFHLNFVNAQHILVEKSYNAHTIFCQFSDVKNGVWSQQPSVLGQLVTGEPQRTRISCPKKTNLIC